jgi:hypothetical protein
MERRVQLPSGMNGLQENCGDGNYPREVRALKTQKSLDRLEVSMQALATIRVESWPCES